MKFAGLELRNPIIVASGPVTAKLWQLQEAEQHGAAAVSIKHVMNKQSFRGNMRCYSDPGEVMIFPIDRRLDVVEGLKLIEEAKKHTALAIMVNFSNELTDIEEYGRMAKTFENAGADALEINMCCPNFSLGNRDLGIDPDQIDAGAITGQNPNLAGAITKIVKSNVKIPVIHLEYADRQELEYLVTQNIRAPKKKKKSQAALAELLGVSPATMSRELQRGRVLLRDSDWREYESYSADVAQDDYDKKATHKGPGLKIGKDHALAKHIEDKILKDKYSPDAVVMEIESGKYEFKTSICTRTVYNYIDQGVFANITNKDLPREGKTQKRKYKRVRKALRNVGGKSISQRPEEANERLEYGHWEMDCVESGKRKGRSCLLVMVERTTRETIILKLSSQRQAEVQKRLDQLERKMGKKRFAKKFKSITVDNGSEFLDWVKLEASYLVQGAKRTAIYYCHPYSSWERGSNEQRNGHIRRFIPKGSDISKYTNKRIKEIEDWLNSYPRRILKGLSAIEAREKLELAS